MNELTSGTGAILLEELLEGDFHQRFGNVNARRDLLVGQPFHHGTQHGLFAPRQSWRIPGLSVERKDQLKSNELALPHVERLDQIAPFIAKIRIAKAVS